MKYKANPITIEAIRYDGSSSSKLEVRDFTNQLATTVRDASGNIQLALVTENGSHFIFEGNYVVLASGKYSVIPEDIFDQNYSIVDLDEEVVLFSDEAMNASALLMTVNNTASPYPGPRTTTSGEQTQVIVTSDTIIETPAVQSEIKE